MKEHKDQKGNPTKAKLKLFEKAQRRHAGRSGAGSGEKLLRLDSEGRVGFFPKLHGGPGLAGRGATAKSGAELGEGGARGFGRK